MFNSAAARSILWTTLYSMVSSAKSLMLVRIYFTMSFIKIKNNIGQRIDPLGTPAKIDSQADAVDIKTNNCFSYSSTTTSK